MNVLGELRGIVVSVHYHDLLSLTLPYNRHHFSEMTVVTTPKDLRTIEVAEQNDCNVYLTDSFYWNGAAFNKWLALERGLDQMLRHGWIVLLDADVLWPKEITLDLEVGQLCTPLRRMHKDLSQPIPPESEWHTLDQHRNVNEHAGYTQIFHATDPVLGNPPWHQIDWTHAGGADSFFQRKWAKENKVRPSWECLHLGPCGANWCGRTTRYLDGSEHETSQENQKRLKEIGKLRSSRQSSFANEFAPERMGR